jgi:hypothetical protein
MPDQYRAVGMAPGADRLPLLRGAEELRGPIRAARDYRPDTIRSASIAAACNDRQAGIDGRLLCSTIGWIEIAAQRLLVATSELQGPRRAALLLGHVGGPLVVLLRPDVSSGPACTLTSRRLSARRQSALGWW